MKQGSSVDKLMISNGAVPYILLQRTELSKYKKLLKKIGLSSFMGAKLESSFRAKDIKSRYINLIYNEYVSIKDYLPNTANGVLDIGCGIALLDLFLSNHYKECDLEIYLLDKSAVSESVYYGYSKEASFYNSLFFSKEILTNSGVTEDNIHQIDISQETHFDFPKVDLIISLLSMGFHYPLSSYLDRIVCNLKEGGRLILDIRKDTGGYELLDNNFNFLECVADRRKYSRFVAYN